MNGRTQSKYKMASKIQHGRQNHPKNARFKAFVNKSNKTSLNWELFVNAEYIFAHLCVISRYYV